MCVGNLVAREHEVRVQVAVAGVGDRGDLDAVAAADLLDRAEHLGQARARHGDVFDEHLPRCRERGVHRPPDGEQAFARGGIRRQRHAPAGGGEERGDLRGLTGGTRGIALREEERLARGDRLERRARERDRPEEGGDPLEPGGVDELEHRRADAGGGDGRGCRGRRLDVGERRGDRHGLAARDRAEAHGGLDDDAERALGAREQGGEVVPRDALDGAMAGAEQPPVGEHHREAEHRLAGDAVLRAEQTAGVRGDVAADRGDGAARRVGREPEAERCERVVELAVEHARLDHGELVGLGDLEDAVHARHVEHDRAGARDGAARESGAGAARHDRRARGVGDAHHRLHLGDGCRVHDRERSGGAAPSGAVLARRLERSGIDRDGCPEGVLELGDDVVRHPSTLASAAVSDSRQSMSAGRARLDA